MADEDGSGLIEFPEFVMLVKSMNCEDEGADQGGLLGSFGF